MNLRIDKKQYSSPNIQCVVLDNEISLALASAPPEGPGETMTTTPDYLNNDPYKNSLV